MLGRFRYLLRLLFHVVTGLSAVLLLASLLLWPRSYYRQDYLRATLPEHMFEALSEWGRLDVILSEPGCGSLDLQYHSMADRKYEPWSYAAQSSEVWGSIGSGEGDEDYARFGLRFQHSVHSGSRRFACAIPFSYLALALAVLPAFGLRSLLRRRAKLARSGFPVEPTEIGAGPQETIQR